MVWIRGRRPIQSEPAYPVQASTKGSDRGSPRPVQKGPRHPHGRVVPPTRHAIGGKRKISLARPLRACLDHESTQEPDEPENGGQIPRTPFGVPPSGGLRPRKRGTPNRPYAHVLPTESTRTVYYMRFPAPTRMSPGTRVEIAAVQLSPGFRLIFGRGAWSAGSPAECPAACRSHPPAPAVSAVARPPLSISGRPWRFAAREASTGP